MIWRGYVLLALMLIGFSLFGEEFQEYKPGGIRSERASIAPVFGRIFRVAPVGAAFNVRNDFVAGLALNLPAGQYFSVEMQGLYGLNTVSAAGFAYGSSEYSGGLTLKLGFNVGSLRPYIGLGGQFVYYDNLYYSSAAPDTWLGLAHGMAGLDIELSRNLILGFRATGAVPVFNRNNSYSYGSFSVSPTYSANPVENISLLLSARLWMVL
ncbi:MAG: hypothetical protein H6617_04785 [Bdellovibrionaceae bacterium]|nr:hypothetical protein [Bdellovibrionales bacterium]MCB9253978.1 hypothetical protein [Pseudobdellovibrionaceae bacterium]